MKARDSGGVWNAEYRVMHPPNCPHAGETRWVAVESSLVCDSQGIPKRLLGVTRDITHQKQAEQALAERNMQLSLAAKAARVGNYAYDPDTDAIQIDAGFAQAVRLAARDCGNDTQGVADQDPSRGSRSDRGDPESSVPRTTGRI